MDIKINEYASATNHLRYLVKVDKGNGLRAEYVVEFRQGQGLVPYLDHYYTEDELINSTLMVDFFDIESLYSIDNQSQFEKRTEMHYTVEELEEFFVNGIAQVIFDVVELTSATIVFAAPYDAALARYYHRLLNKYAADVNYTYREDIREEANFYVLETDKR